MTKICKLEPRPKVAKLFCQWLGGDRFEIFYLAEKQELVSLKVINSVKVDFCLQNKCFCAGRDIITNFGESFIFLQI